MESTWFAVDSPFTADMNDYTYTEISSSLESNTAVSPVGAGKDFILLTIYFLKNIYNL
jgi:hypothetical protein